MREECIAVELALGRHAAVTGELSELTDTHPLRETLWAHLMLALYRSGRQGEALAAYRRAKKVVAEELGLDPTQELQDLERAILVRDPSLDLVVTATGATARGSRGRLGLPQQLPSAIPDFVGREESVQRIRDHLMPGACRTAGGRRHVEVVVVGGRSGVGKSALALHVAHELREHYPDGQLFAHLGTGETRFVQPERVLERFLRALGVAPASLPEGLEALTALYRSELAGRRVLVVLDDAATEGQILPFVPGEVGSALLVTSWRTLPAITGAHRVDLDIFAPSTSAALLSEVLGADRVHDESQAAAALAQVCDHLPLALRIAAAKLSARGHWTIEQMVGRLNDEGRRLDELTLGGVGVRASVALSYAGLSDPASKLLVLLAMHGSTGFPHWVAAPLLDLDVTDADEVLDELVQAKLVEAQSGSDGAARYQLHDLVRIFAAESQVQETVSTAARHRLLRCWLGLAAEAQRREYGDFNALHSDTPPWELPGNVVDGLLVDPLGWFHLEQANLTTAIRLAAADHLDDLCWDLALTVAEFLETLRYVEAWKETNAAALSEVRRANNKRGEAAMLYSRSAPATYEGRFDDAQRDLESALIWFSEAADQHGRGQVLCDLASLDIAFGRYDLALTNAKVAFADLQAVRDGATAAHALNIVAKVCIRRGELDEAAAWLHQAIEVCPTRARRVRVQLTYWLGQVYRARGEFAVAESMFKEVLLVVADLDDPIGRYLALVGLGRVQVVLRDVSAEQTLEAALAAIHQIGEPVRKWHAVLGMAELAIARGDIDAASIWLDEYDALITEFDLIGSPAEYAEARDQVRLGAGVQGE